MANLLENAAKGQIFSVILLILAVVGIILIFSAFAFFLGQASVKHFSIRNLKKRIAKERKEAVKRSRAVIGGQVSEQIAPFLPNFPCNPGDVRFVGKPIDFVGFPGAAEGKPIKEVLLIEVKTGRSQLSQREKEIKAAVDAGKVRYVVWRANGQP